MRVGLLPLCRSTFDLELAERKLSAMSGALRQQGIELAGSGLPLAEPAPAKAELDELDRQGFDQLLVLQLTFTDAATVSEAAARFPSRPLSIWAVKEPREGGRLRLNSLCGLNLASHALGLSGRRFSWLYSDPEEEGGTAIGELLDGRRMSGELDPDPPSDQGASGSVVERLRGLRIGRIGTRPDGFDTCDYDADELEAGTGIAVEEIELAELFSEARAAAGSDLARLGSEARELMTGLDGMDPEALEKSLRIKLALDALRRRRGLDAFAVRCWPEAFTEYGGAVCGPASFLGEERVPCACEADVCGAASQLLLNTLTGRPSFLADLVDMDESDDTGVVWHCGQAPVSMCDPEAAPEAAVHSNRRLPLLFQFPLRPGRVTLMRLSRGRGRTKLVLIGGDMLRRPPAFTGTSGVLRFDGGAGRALHGIIDSGLEHHVAVAYGEHRPALAAAAAELGLPVLEL